MDVSTGWTCSQIQPTAPVVKDLFGHSHWVLSIPMPKATGIHTDERELRQGNASFIRKITNEEIKQRWILPLPKEVWWHRARRGPGLGIGEPGWGLPPAWSASHMGAGAEDHHGPSNANRPELPTSALSKHNSRHYFFKSGKKNLTHVQVFLYNEDERQLHLI